MAEVAAALMVACLPLMPRLFRHSGKDTTKISSKYGSYAQARGPKLQNRYYEMTDDEVQLNGLPSTQTSVYTNQHPSNGNQDNHMPTSSIGKQPSKIYRTISIDQATESI